MDCMGSHTTLEQLRAKHAKEEAALIREALKRNDGNLTAAARDLGVTSTTTMHRLVHETYPELAEHLRGKTGRPKSDDDE